jgi:bla regulator protein BlaR1
MNRASLLTAGLLAAGLCTSVPGRAQVGNAAAPTTSSPDFDVSTVKTNNTGSHSIRVSINDDMLRAENVQVEMLMETAFDMRKDQIVGLPHWAEVNHYDMTAKVVDMTPEQRKGLTKAEREVMMRKLLVERFGLKTHVEKRTLPLMDLVIAKDGIKFSEFKAQSADTPVEPGKPDLKHGGWMSVSNDEMTGTGVEMEALVKFIASQTHMPIVDKTGLPGKYNLHLKWQREEEGAQSGLHDDALPTLYSALTEQLGLKLESGKGPIDVLVVDHIDQPEEN